ncbi:MAG TPA: dihydroorotase [Candidatus Binataceae bacterium]|nr:dihydroorotase [Candidatus Binataceae bacterium]
MNSMLIRGGRVIDPANDFEGDADVLIRDGIIEAVEDPGQIGAPESVPVIDATACWVLPGLIDCHVHLRDPGFPQKETIATGLRAAAAGGFTTVAAMANTSPVNDNPDIARYMLDRAGEVHATRLIPVSAVTKGLKGAELVDFAAMAEAGARLFSDDGIPIDDQMILSRALDELSRLNFAISLHEEDRHLSEEGAANAGQVSKRLGVKGYPNSAETMRIRRDLALAIGTEAPVHIAHLSCAESVELVRHARRNGANVTCEVTPHHFMLADRVILEWGPNAKMNPPLRDSRDVEAIRAAMADGAIDLIATDHAPHDPASKQIDHLAGCFPIHSAHLADDAAKTFTHAANGIIGLETSLGLAMALVHEKIISPRRLVEMMCANPARLLRLEAGALSRHLVADVTIVDPNFEWTVEPAKFLSKSRNTPFAGMRLRGKAKMTIVGGEIVYDARGAARG